MISLQNNARRALLIQLLLVGTAHGQSSPYVHITGDQFTYNGQVYRIKGTNYYPQDHMWASMWSSWDWSEIQSEVVKVRDLGLNAVRILVPYSNGGWNGPNVPASRLQMLEDVVNEFGRQGVRSCVTLFDWETSFPAAGTGTEANHITYLNAIVQRLRNNPYVFCWDVKNEPDHPSNIGGFDNWDSSPASRDRIVSWLGRMCSAVRTRDPNHPVSAGIRWWQNVQDVIAFEDIAMFHSYWPNIGTQQIPEVKGYMGSNQKPILVEEFGWPSNPSPGYNGGVLTTNFTEADQLSFYTTHLGAFAQHNIAGCIQWMTFDASEYSTDPHESFEEHFGLWRYGYSLKPAGTFYRDHFTVSRFPAEPDAVSPAAVTGLTAQARIPDVLLIWTAPSSPDYTGAIIRGKTTGHPTGPGDGQLLGDVLGSPSTVAFFSHTGYLYGTRYYYAVFSHDQFNNFGPAAQVTVVTRVPGDFNGDGDIDMTDFSHMQMCISGPNVPQTNPACQDALLDIDADVDTQDMNLLTRCISGAGVPVAPDCAVR